MTFSAVALSPDGTAIGAASASCSLAVGRSVPALAPGIGAVVTQAWTNRSFRARSLTLLREGVAPSGIIPVLDAEDLRFDLRQVAVLRADGAHAAWTGSSTSPWAGSRSGPGYVVIGNLLHGPGVLDAMAEILEDRDGMPLEESLVSALAAGQRAGGDRRGQQSAVVQVADNAAGDIAPPELRVDLRCDNHPRPIGELEEMLRLRRSEGD